MRFQPPTRSLIAISKSAKTLSAQALARETRISADIAGDTMLAMRQHGVPPDVYAELNAAVTAWSVLVLESQRRIESGG